MMVLGEGLWEVISSQGWSPGEWDSCPYKRDPRDLSHCLSATWGPVRSWQSAAWTRVFTRPQPRWHPDLTLEPPEFWEISVCHLSFLVYDGLSQRPQMTKTMSFKRNMTRFVGNIYSDKLLLNYFHDLVSLPSPLRWNLWLFSHRF